MKKMMKSLIVAALFVGIGTTAYAQKTSESPASATILADLNIALQSGTEIKFGNLSSNTAGEVILDANGTTNANTGTEVNVARFNLTGSNSQVTVNYDPTVTLTGDVQVDDAFPTMTMTPEVVGAATVGDRALAPAVITGDQVTLINNVYFLWVGGSLPALVNQAVGVYTGTFNINVEYN